MRTGQKDVARLAGAAALAVLLTAGLTGCARDSNVRTATTEASGDGTLKVALLLHGADENGGLGAAQRAAVELALADINAAGGLKGQPVELLPASSRGSIAQAAHGYVDGGADVVIGPTDSADAPEAIDVLSAAQIAVISPANGAARLSDYNSGGYYFRTHPSDVMQAYALAQELQAAGKQNVVVLHEDSGYGDAVSKALNAALSDDGRGSSMVSTEDSIRAAVSEAEAADPDAVVVIARESAQAILGQLANSRIDAGKLYLASGATDRYGSALAVGALAGAHGVLPGSLPPQPFQVRLLEVDPGLDHLTFAPEAYDAVILAALAAATAEDDAGTSIAAHLLGVSGNGNSAEPQASAADCESFASCLKLIQDGESIDYQGVSGPVEFDVQGDPSAAQFSLYKYGADNTPGLVSAALITAP